MKTKNYSPNYLSIEFGLDRATALRILKDVQPDGTERGHPVYSTATFAAALELHHLANASNNDGAAQNAGDTSPLLAARVRITNATAEAKERANALAAGLLCPIADVAGAMRVAIEILKENLFAVPSRVTEKISAHTSEDRRAIHKIVESAIYEQMREVVKASHAFMAGLAASAAKGENYVVEINPLGLGNADV